MGTFSYRFRIPIAESGYRNAALMHRWYEKIGSFPLQHEK